MSTWKLCSSASVLAFVYGATVYAAETGFARSDSDTPLNTTITARKMTVRNQESKAIFEGSVVLTKGSLVVHSDAMVVSFKPSDQPGVTGKSGNPSTPEMKSALAGDKKTRSGADDLPIMANRSVSMIEATGRVRIEKAEGRATCQKAVYYQKEEKIVLTGDPVAWQKGTRVTGKQITMYLAEERSVVEGGSRVMIENEGVAR
jgi:lipopolysaccharide export system protein LptA